MSVDQLLVDQDEFAMVLPQCSACDAQGKQVKTTAPSGKKQCAAPSGRKRGMAAAEAVEAERVKQRKPAPDPDAGMDKYDIIGKKVQGNYKLHYWEKIGGGHYRKDECTWQVCPDSLTLMF